MGVVAVDIISQTETYSTETTEEQNFAQLLWRKYEGLLYTHLPVCPHKRSRTAVPE